MPTASPSISARMATVDVRPSGTASAETSPKAMATPNRAVSSDSPAATSDPRARTSTTAATATPMSSVVPPGSSSESSAEPPTSTVSPAPRAWFAASSRALFVDSVRSTALSV